MPSKQPLIEILMATYKAGESFSEQLDSLCRQTYRNYDLIIRDDGADDKIAATIGRLPGEIKERTTLLEDKCGQLGVLGNFSRLLAESKADYIMFCDQDDVWDAEKIDKTLAVMLAMENDYGKATPLLVHTDLKVVDHKLEVIAESLWKHQNLQPHNRETFSRLLVQNVITGCTVMINKSLREIALPIPEQAVMHDRWLALVASAFGRIGHVDQATMLYRQHKDNQIGAKSWGLPFVVKHALGHDGKVREGILHAQQQARAFADAYQDKLPEHLHTTLEAYASMDQQAYLKKVYLLIKHRLFKAGLIRNFGLWTHI